MYVNMLWLRSGQIVVAVSLKVRFSMQFNSDNISLLVQIQMTWASDRSYTSPATKRSTARLLYGNSLMPSHSSLNQLVILRSSTLVIGV